MKKIILTFALLLMLLFSLCSCNQTSSTSTLVIRFIDVGQGDAALIECDGHYMLIDGGTASNGGDNVYRVLEENCIKRLDILAISHFHEDHYGGLSKALTYADSIGITISNSTYSPNDTFEDFENQLIRNGSKITVPSVGTRFELGSATVEVVDVCADSENDSLVLLITYGDTRFLFTGDIEETAQTRISDKYENALDEPFKINLIKMPHHGAYTTTLYHFLRTFMPEYAVISVGNNTYGHPSINTLELLEDANFKRIYRTDKDGDIIVKSNGKEISVETTK